MNIAITGVGVVSPLGHSAAELVDALLAGRTALAPIQGFAGAPFECPVAAVVTQFKARDWVSNRKNLKLMTPATRFGLAAVKRAYAQSVLEGAVDPGRLGIFVGAGTAFGESEDLAPALARSIGPHGFDSAAFGRDGMHLINPLWLLKGLSNNILGFATADLDAQGINQNYCNSPVGGLQAIGEAAWALIEGKADAILAGGADSAVNAAHLTGFGRLEMLSPSGNVSPFGAHHDGFAPGEGGAFFALERPADAAARGQPALARIVGYGNAGGAHALTTGVPESINLAFRGALRRASWSPADVDLVYAHGSATAAFDAREAEALGLVFGSNMPPITANKGQIGHSVAASGALSIACAIEVARRGAIPAAGDYALARACADVDLVRGAPREAGVRRVCVHAAGLGGQTTCIALEIDP